MSHCSKLLHNCLSLDFYENRDFRKKLQAQMNRPFLRWGCLSNLRGNGAVAMYVDRSGRYSSQISNLLCACACVMSVNSTPPKTKNRVPTVGSAGVQVGRVGVRVSSVQFCSVLFGSGRVPESYPTQPVIRHFRLQEGCIATWKRQIWQISANIRNFCWNYVSGNLRSIIWCPIFDPNKLPIELPEHCLAYWTIDISKLPWQSFLL